VGKYAVDFDRTLAYYESGWFHQYGSLHLGEPIPAMQERVKGWLREGKEVIIFTARLDGDDPAEVKVAIEDWTEKHLGKRLEVTNVKTFDIETLYDDRSVQVVANTGRLVEEPDTYFSPDADAFCAKYNLGPERMARLLEMAMAAEESETQQLNDAYEEYCDPLISDGPLLSLEEYRERVFEYDAGSVDEERAYNFLRLIRDD